MTSPHQYGALLHTPGHVAKSPLLQGVAGAGPGAGGGAELLAGGSWTAEGAATQQEPVLGVDVSLHLQPGQLAGGVGGGEEHLR